jgi:CubicO group peptidase (beta-lactamase class C family)
MPSSFLIHDQFDKPDSPGCALAVIKDNQIIYKRGYGMADLDHDIPIKPDTPFHVASVSKQFTAFAILLLAQQGKLSLDDKVQKYITELREFDQPITIRHLLHHTSGLRDQWNLLIMSGWRLGEDVVRDDDILDLVSRMKELNFKPGAHHRRTAPRATRHDGSFLQHESADGTFVSGVVARLCRRRGRTVPGMWVFPSSIAP